MVEITQFMWQHRDIQRELGWTILVLITKGNTDTKGIGLLESMWKVVEVIINTRLRASVRLHNVLHLFCAGRVMGMEILELNLVQYIASVDHDPLLLIFLDLQKAYDTVDRGHVLTTL